MKRGMMVVVAAALLAVALGLYGGLREDDGVPSPAPALPAAELIAKGEYLARAGDCRACHTARGGAAYAGGRAIRTPFGTITSPNITPDKATGIGDWNANDFWRALHNGKSKDGRLLYPAFPYPNTTRITRADSDALFAYFKSIAPVHQPNRDPELRFPFNLRPLLAVWRALYFRPGVYQADTQQSTEWNRGAYLVQGLGHCSACHTPRNALGATLSSGELSGAMIPMLGWHAASLAGDNGVGVTQWSEQELVDLLKTGISARGTVSGPMAEVVRESLQYLSQADAHAMAIYLKSLPARADTAESKGPKATPENEQTLKLGAKLYEKHCAECHKASGRGAPPDYPALAGNRALLLDPPVNPIRAVLHGGYPPSTEGNPRPYGMPPFGTVLSDQEAAAVLSFVRNAWGNRGAMVSAEQVNRSRPVALD